MGECVMPILISISRHSVVLIRTGLIVTYFDKIIRGKSAETPSYELIYKTILAPSYVFEDVYLRTPILLLLVTGY